MIEKHLFGKWQNVPLTKFHRDFSNEIDTSVFENGPCAQIEHLGDCRFQRVKFTLWKVCPNCTVFVIKINITGGGGCLVKSFAKCNSDRVKFVDDICAAAKGYEYMAELQLKADERQ